MEPQGRETKVFMSKSESLGLESEESRWIFSKAMTEKEWTQKKKSEQMCRVRSVYRALGQDRRQLGRWKHETNERRDREWPRRDLPGRFECFQGHSKKFGLSRQWWVPERFKAKEWYFLERALWQDEKWMVGEIWLGIYGIDWIWDDENLK